MAEPIRDPGKLQAQIDEFQNLQRQMQLVMMQHQQIQVALEELKAAKAELAVAKGEVFKAVGGLMIQTDVASAKKDVDEKLEVFTVREGTLAKQEEKLKGRLESLRADLETATRGMSAGNPGASPDAGQEAE